MVIAGGSYGVLVRSDSDGDPAAVLAAGLGLTAGGAGIFTAGALTHHATTVHAADPLNYAPRPGLQAFVDAHNASLRDELGLSGNVTFHVVVTPSSVGVEAEF